MIICESFTDLKRSYKIKYTQTLKSIIINQELSKKLNTNIADTLKKKLPFNIAGTVQLD